MMNFVYCNFWLGFVKYALRYVCFSLFPYHVNEWAGKRSRYSDCLRAGRSGDRIPVEARFSAPVQTDPDAHTASCKMGNVSFPGVSCGRGVTLTPHPLLVPRSKIE
jgi:hypothetical protein